MTQKKKPRVFPSASRKESRRSANRYVKLVFRTLGTKEREKEIYVFGRPKEMQHFSGPHFYIFMGPAMIARKFTIFDQRSSKKKVYFFYVVRYASFQKAWCILGQLCASIMDVRQGKNSLGWIRPDKQASMPGLYSTVSAPKSGWGKIPGKPGPTPHIILFGGETGKH